MTDPAQPGDEQVRGGEHADPPVTIRLHLPGLAPRTPPPPGATTMRVETDGAVYVLDARSMTAIRLRRDGSHLRRDGEPLTLLSWPAPVVGQGMALLLLVREDGLPSTRFNSDVRRIDRGPA